MLGKFFTCKHKSKTEKIIAILHIIVFQFTYSEEIFGKLESIGKITLYIISYGQLTTWVLMEALVHQRKSLVLILMKQTQNFGDHSYLLVDGKEIFKVKADNFFFHFPTQICL